MRALDVARLPAHDTAFALTIHKAQGSQYREVAVVLPDHPSPLLTRELVYTALTRASVRVTLAADPALLPDAITRRVARASSLATLLGSYSAAGR